MKFTDIKVQYLKWYHKLFLWMIPKITVKELDKGYVHILVYKKWKGKIYILSDSHHEIRITL